MKRIFSCFTVLALLLSILIPASASGTTSIQDHADLLSNAEVDTLAEQISEIQESYGVSVYLITLESLYGKTPEEYADNYYDSYLSGDAIIFVVSMQERLWTFRTFEGAVSVITDWDIDPIMQSTLPTLSAGRYSDSFTILLSMIAEEYADYTTPNWALRIGIPVGIGLVAALVTLLIMRSKMKTDKQQHGAASYMIDGSFDLFRCHDIYLYSHTRRSLRAKSSSGGGRSGGGGGGSRGGRSGSF